MMERFNKLTPQQQQKFILLQQQRLEDSQKQKLQQQQQLRGSTTSPSSAVPPRAASPTAMKHPAVIGGANQRPAGNLGGVTQQHQHQQQQQPMSKEDMARRLQRLGFLKQQQSLIDAHQQAAPSVIPDSIRKASLIQTQRGRGLSLKQTSIPTSAVGAVGTLATTVVPTTSSRDQSPFNEEEDLDSDRLFVLSSKHCGAQVITKYNVALHYFVAGVDVAPPPPAPPPAPSSSMPVTQHPPAATLVDSSISVLPPQALSAVAGASVTTLDGSLASLSVGGRVSTPTLPTSQQGAEHLSQNAQRSTPTKPPSPPVVGSRGQSPAPVAAAAAAKLDFSAVSPPSGTPTKALNVQLPPQPPPAASAASAAAKKHRLVFCIAENPNASLRPVEERQAMWRALTALSKLHMVCSMRTFKATFASFFVEDEEDDSAGKEKKPTAAGSDLHVKSTSSAEKKKVAHALRDLTRSSAVPILNALFPIFDQSLSSSTEVVTAAVTREENSGEAVFRGTRCWDSSGTVWCPVARLGRIVIQDSSSTAAASPPASSDPSASAPPQGKTVYALNPLTVALREDISYVTKLPIMNELQDKFMNKRQNLVDEHQSNVGNLQKEMSMLELELEWAQEQLDGRHAKHDSSMKELQRSLEDLHMRLQEASGRRFYIPVETKKKELERNYPSGALERSPIRQQYHWNPAIVDDTSGTTTAAAQLFSRKLGTGNILFDDADQQAVLLSAAHPRSTNMRLSQHTARVPDAIAQTAVGKLLKGWTQAHSYEPKLAAAQTTSSTTAVFEAQAKGPVILAHQTQVQNANAHPNAHHGKNEDEILPAAKFGIRPVKSAAQTLTKDASMSQHNDNHSIARALRF
ncbi:Hypothetical protein, putative [Bodo saltans]|uniref:Uncharacterized protein n=1 Tax=Bodo saltans TaxID=75058 RepID=A0A0S4JVW1_BODSA|nr:Hypothetical protein, putative [Bodo saltans]|eukprot:CUG93594.1 Hypothetical protein, putative [Bodo saltans]